MKNSKFNLIEILISIVVIGILSAIVILNIRGHSTEAKESALENDLRNIELAVDMYGMDHNGVVPTEDRLPVGKGEEAKEIDLELLDNYLKKKPKDKNLTYYLNEGGSVSVEKEKKLKSLLKTIDMEFEESNLQEQTHLISINGLKKVRNVIPDSGTAEIVSTEGDLVTVKLTGGAVSNTVEKGGMLTLEDSKEVTAEDSKNYNKDGYVGTLNQYVHSGNYIAADNKEVTNSIKSSTDSFVNTINYSKDGYSGVLSKSGSSIAAVTSGDYTAAKTKSVNDSRKSSTDSFNNTLTYSEEGYSGVLNKDGSSIATAVSGSYTPLDKKVVSEDRKSSFNSFNSSINYSEGGYSGELNKSGAVIPTVVSGSYTPLDKKTVSDSKKSSTNSFSNTINYSSGGYSGELNKSGAVISTAISGSYTPEQKQWVTAQTVANYNQNGYAGTLSQYVYSGSAADSIPIQGVSEITTPIWHKNVSFPPSPYNDGVYSGTVYPTSINWTTVPQSVTLIVQYSQYSTSNSSPEMINVDRNEALRVIKNTFNASNPDGINFINPTVQNAAWTSNIYSGNFVSDGKSYPYLREANITIRVDGFIYKALYEGTAYKPDTRVYRYQGEVTKPAVDTRVWEYTQNYSGEVTKPAVDTRVWEYTQSYSGEVTKPAVDTRVWEYTQNYSGEVTKPAVDTRVWEYTQNYSGEVTKPAVDTRVYKYSGTVNRPYSDTRTYENLYKYKLQITYD